MLTLKKFIRKNINRQIKRTLNDADISSLIYSLINDAEKIGGHFDVGAELKKRACIQSAEYVEGNMQTVEVFDHRFKLLGLSLSKVMLGGLYLEFGVASGSSINYISERVAKDVHGFDAFEGLPENWIEGVGKGAFASGGMAPDVRDNVKLHVGWFEDTLPKFCLANKENIAFMHIDCDIYSATKTVFEYLGDRIISGTVIQFDEYFNYPGWKNHEYKAFQEFVVKKGIKYEYLGYNRMGYSVAIKIL